MAQVSFKCQIAGRSGIDGHVWRDVERPVPINDIVKVVQVRNEVAEADRA
jgi:hypothetical protein